MTLERPGRHAPDGAPALPTWHDLRVAQVTALTDEAVAIDFDVPDALREAFRFRPGQHVTIAFGDGADEVRRSYSICTPASSGRLQVAVKRVPEGVLSTHLTTQLSAGDTLAVMTPTGRFAADIAPSQRKHYGLVAAGSGITPIISILETVLEDEPKSSVTLVYGNQTRATTMFLAELDELRKRHGRRLTLHHMRSREPIADPICRGRLDTARLDALLRRSIKAATVDEWFLCGPAGMVQDARVALAGHDVPPERVHVELFQAAEALEPLPQTTPRETVHSTVTLTAAGRSVSFPLDSDGETILQAALPLMPDVPYACRDGVCATCRAKVVEGEVLMDRCSSLDAEERQEGYVLACQAHPVTEHVELQFDV